MLSLKVEPLESIKYQAFNNREVEYSFPHIIQSVLSMRFLANVVLMCFAKTLGINNLGPRIFSPHQLFYRF